MGSVSLVSVFDSLPTELHDQVEERVRIYQNAFADNTNRARAADFKIYKAWCDQNQLRATDSLQRRCWRDADRHG